MEDLAIIMDHGKIKRRERHYRGGFTMLFKRSLLAGIVTLCTALAGCAGGGGLGTFQKNEPDRDYQIFCALDGYDNIKDLFTGLDMNYVITTDLPEAISANYNEFDTMSRLFKLLVNHEDRLLTSTLNEVRDLLAILKDDERHYVKSGMNSFYETTGMEYGTGLYELLNDLGDTEGLTEDAKAILRKTVNYVADDSGYNLDTPAGMRDLVQKLIDKIEGIDQQDIRDLSEVVAKFTIQSDYPMYVDSGGNLVTDPASIDSGDTNLDLGNTVRGSHLLMRALNDMLAGDPNARDLIYNSESSIVKGDLPALVDPANTGKFKTLLQNMEKYFTAGGAGFNSDYSNSGTWYVNAELKNSLRELWPGLVKLFIRDRAATEDPSIPDYSIINDRGNGKSAVERMVRSFDKLKKAGIDFSNYDGVESSLKRMLRYDGYGQDRTGSGYNVSFLDHLLVTIAGSLNFGYKTRMSYSGEPDRNPQVSSDQRGHGEPTHGIITVNDCMYAMQNSGLDICGITATAYNLALDTRTDQAAYIGRSSSPFGNAQIGSHKFYMGYDYPTMLLLPAACAGDAGIPNGGETVEHVKHGSDIEPIGTIANTTEDKDFLTYFPKVGDGIGEMNTACFVMGWISRACWEGEAPYYYSPEKAGQAPVTVDCDLVNNGTGAWGADGSSETWYLYYKPNGEVYSMVYKRSAGDRSTWVHLYPTDGDDIEDPATNVISASELSGYAFNGKRQRTSRYRDQWYSDYFLVRRGHKSGEFCAPPMNEAGSGYVEGTSGADRFKLTPGNFGADRFMFREKIRTNDATRECSSQEEAMFRNYQWLALEKKFVFTIPMNVYKSVLIITIHSAAFVVIEGNGILGLGNAKKGASNGSWVLKGSEGLDVDDGRWPHYGDSTVAGDGRYLAFVKEDSGIVTLSLVWDTILGSGNVFPGAVGQNIDPIVRLGMLQSGLVESNASGSAWSDAWAIRNRIFPVLVTAVGSLHETTKYTPGTGHDYNYPASTLHPGDEGYPHKYPIRDVLEGLVPVLAKPQLRYINNSDTGSVGRWAPRIDRQGGSDGLLDYLSPTPKVSGDYKQFFRPRRGLRTLMNLLSDSNSDSASTRADGVLPMICDSGAIVTHALALLQKMGNNDAGSIYRNDAKKIRMNIFTALEQIITSVKTTKGEVVTKEESGESTPVYGDDQYTHLDYTNYQWMFKPAMRAEDFDLDWALTKLVDDRLALVDTWTQDPDWNEFGDTFETLSNLLDKRKPAGDPGKYCITDNLGKIVDALFADKTYTDDEFAALLYTLGKYVAYYDRENKKWLYQGDEGFNDLVVLLKELLPKLHGIVKDDTGQNYYDMKILMDAMMADGGLVTKISDRLNNAPDTPGEWETLINEVYTFLGDDAVGGSGSLWFKLSDMFEDLLAMKTASMSAAEKIEFYKQFYRQYGFQFNGF